MKARLFKHAAALVLGSLCFVPVLPEATAATTPPVVTLTVSASDPHKLPLHYQWKSTDGSISPANADVKTVTWTLPNGPGIHFAYVLVSNRQGGYIERRFVVNTDTIGTARVTTPIVNLAAPAVSLPAGNVYRAWAVNGGATLGADFVPAYAANALVYVLDTVTRQRIPASGTIQADVKGQYVVPGLLAGHAYEANCSFDGGATFVNCTSGANQPNYFQMPSSPATAWTDYGWNTAAEGGEFSPVAYSGSLVLSDGSPCGTVNEFFNTISLPTATLRNAAGTQLATSTISPSGVWSLPYKSTAYSILLKCEQAPAITLLVGSANGFTTFTIAGSAPPTIDPDPTKSTATAVIGGKVTSVGKIQEPFSGGFASDTVPASDAFLAEQGLDSAVSACQYYVAIGAVQRCNSDGSFAGSVIGFEDWKRQVQIDDHASTTVYSAVYINKADLNLTRVHHSVSYGPTATAAYVCNYLGYNIGSTTLNSLVSPSDVTNFLAPDLNDQTTLVDPPIANAAAGDYAKDGASGKDLVACVAMQWGTHPNVNGGTTPFTSFLIFGPSGELLPSVNLDIRREKYVPGTCVVCHGGDRYAGRFQPHQNPDIGAHFIPYDVGNFLFSKSIVSLTKANQQTAIYHLNQNVLNTGPTPQAAELIRGWYAAGTVQNENFVPAEYSTASTDAVNFYRDVQARSCRGCHITQIEAFDWEHPANFGNLIDGRDTVCNGAGSGWRGHSMPNSLITMNRFWLSHNNSANLPDQVALFDKFPGLPQGANCVNNK
ncbi:MAG: hypothetical protein JO133_05605 [Burkholderiaceae bacterium]|nr:hypothetical protein [Burkholderiaceae bacterium]